jgi:hypothetical protein
VSESLAEDTEVFSKVGRQKSGCIKKTAGVVAVTNMDQ